MARLSYTNVHLAALARTCRTFKEPALGMIWAELRDLTPLVRCLPRTSWIESEGLYSLKKRLEQSEWQIILGYTSRVQALPNLHCSMGLTRDCIQQLSKPPISTSPSIFPNLRVVGLFVQGTGRSVAPFVRHLANPKLTKLILSIGSVDAVIGAFRDRCPTVVDLRVACLPKDEADAISDLICHWRNLSSVHCPSVCLNIDALIHLSASRALTSLTFEVHNAVLDRLRSTQSFTSSLTISALCALNLESQSLALAQRFFHHVSLPGIRDLTITVYSPQFSSDLASLLVALQQVRICDTLTSLNLRALFWGDLPNVVPNITFDHVRSLSVFANIKSISLNLPFALDLNERELLGLASSWPHLEKFQVGRYHVWTTSSAITPGGFLQLLERCRSLRVLHFMLDTCGYTEIPQGHPWRGLTMPKDTVIRLLDSPIQEESIEALGVFFHVAPHPYFTLDTHWTKSRDLYRAGEVSWELYDLYRRRWEAVRKLAGDLWEKRKELRHSLETRSSQHHP